MVNEVAFILEGKSFSQGVDYSTSLKKRKKKEKTKN